MEVSQAIWLTPVFITALLISPKRFDEIILDFYQDAGIWIVIASCVAEYLLLLTYIGVAAYDFFKNRKMMKKMNVQRRTYEFLKFDESHRDVGNRLKNPEKGRVDEPAAIKVRSNFFRKSRDPLPSSKPTGSSTPKSGRSMPNRAVHLDAAAPNNPQLLKFDGDSKKTNEKEKTEKVGRTWKNWRWMNKSLKRKQIE